MTLKQTKMNTVKRVKAVTISDSPELHDITSYMLSHVCLYINKHVSFTPASSGQMLFSLLMLWRTLVTAVHLVSLHIITVRRKQDLLSVYTYSACTHGFVHVLTFLHTLTHRQTRGWCHVRSPCCQSMSLGNCSRGQEFPLITVYIAGNTKPVHSLNDFTEAQQTPAKWKDSLPINQKDLVLFECNRLFVLWDTAIDRGCWMGLSFVCRHFSVIWNCGQNHWISNKTFQSSRDFVAMARGRGKCWKYKVKEKTI